MNNLLRQPLPERELTAIFADCPPVPLMPRQGDGYWKEIAAKPLGRHWLPAIQELARGEAADPLPGLTDEMFSDFSRTGNRLRCEEIIFERRRRWSRAAICALFEPDEPLCWNSLLEKWRAIFAEKSWALPAHVADPSGQDGDVIDLFSAETSSAMCDLLSLFEQKTPADFVAAIRTRARHMQDLYLAAPESFLWTKITNNWNAVCHQGIIGSALAIEGDPEHLARLLATAMKYLPRFLEGMSPDGGCTEGPSYWNYGFGWFCRLNEQLEQRTRGRLSLIEGDALIEKLAHYGRRMALAGGQLINFADCRPKGIPSPPLLAYLGARLHQPENTALAASEFRALLDESPELDIARSGFLQILRHLMTATGKTQVTSVSPESYHYPDLGVWISRGFVAPQLNWTLAAKAGHNEEHHNHNDCGSFLLQLKRTVFIAEIGTPEYVREFFKGETRYSFLTARSFGHSVPLINGVEQHAGAQYNSKIAATNFGEVQDRVAIDYGASYPKEAGVKSTRREITIDKATLAVTLRDSFELERAESFESALITFLPPRREGDSIILESGGVRLRIEPQGQTRLRAKSGPIPDGIEATQSDPAIDKLVYSNPFGQRTEVYRITFEPVALSETCETEILLSASPIT